MFDFLFAKFYSMNNEQTQHTGTTEKKGNALPDAEVTGSNTEKDPDEWTTGGELMTGAQKSYLKTLSDEAGEEFNDNFTKAEASKRIDELQHKTGRGLHN